MTTNADIEREIVRSLPDVFRKLGVLQDGYRCDVHLHRGNRKKRRDAKFEGNWDPDADSIRIVFSPAEGDGELAREVADSPATLKSMSAEERLSELLRALDRAESRPGYEFVSLKWFRDTALTHEEFSWATDEPVRHDVLREAIDRRWILTSKIPNPRPPHFPVTAIRLNRQMSEIDSALGGRGGGIPAFHPIAIRGGSLSATVLHDRR